MGIIKIGGSRTKANFILFPFQQWVVKTEDVNTDTESKKKIQRFLQQTYYFIPSRQVEGRGGHEEEEIIKSMP